MSALVHGLNEEFLQRDVLPSPREGIFQGLANWPRVEVRRKAPQREGSMLFEITQARALYEESQDRITQAIEDLKASYIFTNDAVDQFLADHRALPGILREAIEPLRNSFGTDKIFRLEVSIDEDDSKMLYVIALWRDTVRAAAQALDDFAERWWLDHMTPNSTDLAFIYKISR